MSRIGKLPIKLGDKVKAVVQGDKINFEGPKGKLSIKIPVSDIKVEVKGSEILITRPSDHRTHRSAHGLTRAILANAAKGVGTGWERALAIRGVGFRAEVKGKQIHFALGYSHPVVFDLPEGVTAEVGKAPRTEDALPTIDLTLRSADRHLLGQTAVQIRALRPPEPYKGKSIKLSDETVRRKEGKTGTA
jgi:large subunit ribosomal protein L6